MAKTPVDPLRARLLELLEQLGDRATQLRDYASTPGNTWLAKNELSHISQVISDLEALLDDIKDSDAENGY
jgi:hypothetical protein